MDENQKQHDALEPGDSRLKRIEQGWLLSASLLLADRPGELAEVSVVYAEHRANITTFRFNRGEDPHLVTVTAALPDAASAGALAGVLAARGWMDERSKDRKLGPQVTDSGGLLTLKLSLEDKPGTLARAAMVMAEHRANVIHMAYDNLSAPGMAEFTLATNAPDEVEKLLCDLKRRGYHSHVTYRGGESGDIDRIIGLSSVETFLFKLKTLLPEDKLDELTSLIDSSDELRHALRDFHSEAGDSGESLAASEVFTSILQLAAASVTRTGDNFSLTLTGPLRLTDRVRLYMVACPTGANGYLLDVDQGVEYVLIDSSYGLYYPDFRNWLGEHGMDPARIRRAFFTHPDADHAGFAAPLHAEFSTTIHMPPLAAEIFTSNNRAHGSGSQLESLNAHYTKLINRFTDLRAPKKMVGYGASGSDCGGFQVVGKVTVGDVELTALHSLGGHVSSQVFLYSAHCGLLFSGDYLIDVPSLSDRAKSTLSLARFLMTSTNIDSTLFAQEMKLLQALMRTTNRALAPSGKRARIFPGHGSFYAVDEADWHES